MQAINPVAPDHAYDIDGTLRRSDAVAHELWKESRVHPGMEHPDSSGIHPGIRPAPGSDDRAGSSGEGGADHDLANLMLMTDSDLDLLPSGADATEASEAVRSVWARTARLRAAVGEMRTRAADSGMLSRNRQTSLAAWWPAVGSVPRAAYGGRVNIDAHVPSGLPAVCVKPQQLTQIVLNLVRNAAAGIADRASGDSRSAGSGSAAGRRDVRISARLAGNGRSVELAVSDDGMGMAPAVLSRACDPFFTTRAGCGSLGLGLAVIRRLLGAVGGGIRLSSALGAGTTVTLRLPMF